MGKNQLELKALDSSQSNFVSKWFPALEYLSYHDIVFCFSESLSLLKLMTILHPDYSVLINGNVLLSSPDFAVIF